MARRGGLDWASGGREVERAEPIEALGKDRMLGHDAAMNDTAKSRSGGDAGTAPSFDHDRTELVRELMPFAGAIGLQIVTDTSSETVATADWRAERCTVGGALHGGYLMALADSVGAICALANLPAGAVGTSTIESKTNFLRAATQGPITIRSAPLHAGRTTIVVQTDITRPDGKIVTRTIQTQAVLTA